MSKPKSSFPSTPLAFPFIHPTGLSSTGMTLRDYFAGQALSGLLEDYSIEFAAEKAYEIADAMLKRRGS